MKRSPACLLALLLLFTSTAKADQLDRGVIFTQNKRAAVKIVVTGRDATGLLKRRNGSGVMVRSSGAIVTSLSIVGRDEDWAESPQGGRDRRIEIFALDDNSVVRSLGPASAAIVPGREVAILRITGENFPHASIDDAPVTGLPSVVAIIWDPAESLPGPVTSDIVPTDAGKNGDGLTIRLAPVEGHDGAGVFGANGRLIGVITRRIDPSRVLAAPIYSFNAFLPPRSRVRPDETEIVACESQERARKIERQPFSTAGSIRCQNMGDSRRGVVTYKAPADFTIVGQVNKSDEANYGTVGPVEYRTEGERVTEAKVDLSCSTPNRPFGPGGWAGSTLSGFIERALSQNEINRIRQACLKRP
jgi:hypothetical protein